MSGSSSTASLEKLIFANFIGTEPKSQLYSEVNSVKKHDYKIWLNDGVY